MIGLGWVAQDTHTQGPKTGARGAKCAESESMSHTTQPNPGGKCEQD